MFKTFIIIIMAKYELKFLDEVNTGDFIKVEVYENPDDGIKYIEIQGCCDYNLFTIFLSKSTAIKFAKTLRTEINKITESEVNNG